VVQVKEKSRSIQKIETAMEAAQQRGVAEWLEVEQDKMQVTVRALPNREQVPETIEEQLVIELYSK
jgi:small subunit ribosomal protein S4